MEDSADKPTIEQMKAQLAEFKAKQEKASEVTETFKNYINEENNKLSKAAFEAQQKIAAIQAEHLKIAQAIEADKKMWLEGYKSAQDKLSNYENEAINLEKQIKTQEEFEQAQAANLILNEKWEKMLMGVPWREWARDHQLDGAKQFAQQKHMILADSMGLGKTLTAIMSLDFIRAATSDASPDNPYEPDEEDVYNYQTNMYDKSYVNGVERTCGIRVLYIAPSSLQANVVEEFRHWAPHRNVVPLGNMSKAQRDFAMSVADEQDNFVALINYEAWAQNKTVLDDLLQLNFDTVIIDEAHNAKDTTSSVYKGIKKICHEGDTPFILPMTGTPVLNNPVDLFAMLHLIDSNKFYSKSSFMRNYCRQTLDMHGTTRWEFKYGGVEQISSMLGKRYLRRTKETAGIVLPPLTVEQHLITIDESKYAEQAKARKAMREHAMVILKDTDDNGDPKAIPAGSELAIRMRLRQIETWPAGIIVKDERGNEVDRFDVQESQKLDYVIAPDGSEGLALQLLTEERLVIFSQFVEPLRVIQERLREAGKNAALLTGQTHPDVKKEISHDFDVKFRQHRIDGHKYDAVLAHYRVGGVGLNFTEASQMIILDEEWNPGKRDQAYGRMERMGQEKPMTVHVIHDEGTIDDWLHNIMEFKENLVNGFSKGMSVTAQDMYNALESGLM